MYIYTRTHTNVYYNVVYESRLLRNKKSKCPSVGNWFQEITAHTREHSKNSVFIFANMERWSHF